MNVEEENVGDYRLGFKEITYRNKTKIIVLSKMDSDIKKKILRNKLKILSSGRRKETIRNKLNKLTYVYSK